MELKKRESSYLLQTPAGKIPYFLRRSRHRRTIEIVIGDSSVRVSAPVFTPESHIQEFLLKKSRWVIEKLKEADDFYQRLQARRYISGEKFLFLGKEYPLQILQEGYIRKIVFDQQGWQVRVPIFLSSENFPLDVKTQMMEWYQHQAQEMLPARTVHYAQTMNLTFSKVVIRSQKRIWGSCHHQNRNIHLNWRLVLAPIEVIDYVVVHELCHLLVPNHSRCFWQQVQKVLPDYQLRQKWLKTHRLEMAW